MRKVILLLFLVVLYGCSFNNPFLRGEINKVTVVKYSPYMKHHRIFLTRSNLKIIKDGKKYLYLYHKKNNDLAVLVQRKNTFFLYTLSNPKQKTYSLRLAQGKKYTDALKHFRSMGYRSMTSTAKKGFLVSVSYKRYKNNKTLLFEVKDYTRLLYLYKKAIRNYDASKIKTIKTQLAKSLILPYFKRYEKQAKSKKQREQLQIIAQKLQLKRPNLDKKIVQTSSTKAKDNKNVIKEEIKTKKESEIKESSSWYTFSTKEIKIEEEKTAKVPVQIPYTYYLNNASLNELSSYLAGDATLSNSEYSALKQRERNMKEKELLETGTLEELIAAYKSNKKPKFKQRILSLMKEKQQE